MKQKINNDEIKNEIINFIGRQGIEMLQREYKTHKQVFPLVVVDGIPISFNMHYGQAIRNHINEKFNVMEITGMDYTQYEDYIYEIVKSIIENYEN